eukprot:scpid6148/ scgid10338/ 
MCGDERCDSPGYSAKFGTYTFLEAKMNLIVDFDVVEYTVAKSSVAMEKVGFSRVLDRGKESLTVDVVVIDRSPSIKATMRDQYPGIMPPIRCVALCQECCQQAAVCLPSQEPCSTTGLDSSLHKPILVVLQQL